MFGLLTRAVVYWLLAAATLLVLAGCGADESELREIQREYGHEPELANYVSEFRSHMAARGLGFGKAPGLLMWRNLDADDAIGLCILPYRFIYIHPALRAPSAPEAVDANGALRRALVYHELAHCMYGGPHEEAAGHILSPYLDGAAIAEWGEVKWTYELDRLAAWISVASTSGRELQLHRAAGTIE